MGYRTFTREELYELVWAEPISALAKRLGISGRGLGKACARGQIPVPERGYWQKIEAGQKVSPTPLTKATAHTPRVVNVQIWPEGKPSNPVAETALADLTLAEAIEQEKTPARAINVPAPGPLHKTARLMQQHLARAKPDKFGAVNVGEVACPFHIRITPLAVDRVIAIADALLKAIESRGWKVVPAKLVASTHFIVGDTEVWLWITERIRRIDHVQTAEERAQEERARKSKSWDYSLSLLLAPKWDFLPTGELTIEIYGARTNTVPTKIKDTTEQTVEARLNELMTLIWQAAAVNDAEQSEQREQEKLRFEREAIAAREKIAREAEAVRQQALVKDAVAWRQAQDIREYVRKASESPESIGHDFDAWARWALGVAAAIDPVARVPWRAK